MRSRTPRSAKYSASRRVETVAGPCGDGIMRAAISQFLQVLRWGRRPTPSEAMRWRRRARLRSILPRSSMRQGVGSCSSFSNPEVLQFPAGVLGEAAAILGCSGAKPPLQFCQGPQSWRGPPREPAARSAEPFPNPCRGRRLATMRLCTLALLAAFTPFLAAQTIPASALEGLSWRSIGPATTGGRIADFAVAEVPGEPEVMYVGTASGGVFKSANAGVSWTPVFDHADGAMLSIGAVAVAPSNPSILWVGTGEVDNRQSSSWGNGIYKSLDGGATWHAMGLADSRHIAKILIDPHDANTVYVAALGHLWGSNSERGVYKTIDGGAHWVQVLKVNENTGATDLATSPANPNLIFAAMYQRQRRGWGFNGGGPGSGLYRSSDGGATWTELSHGLPAGDKGRIGVAVFPGDPRIVYAIIEADPAGGGRGGRGGPAPALKGGVFRSTDEGQTWEHMSGLNPRPSYYSRIYVDPRDPDRVYIMGSE